MLRRRWIVVFILLFMLTVVAWGTVSAKKAPFTDEQVTWEISKAEIINVGETHILQEGTLVDGFVIQAKAKAKDNNVVPEGTIVITLSAFTPNQQMPGQVPGVWYLQGKWEITKLNASLESTKARHSPDKADGFVKAELTFNPLTEPGEWTGLATVPMSLTAGRWSLGEGYILLNGQFEGELQLILNQLPKLQ